MDMEYGMPVELEFNPIKATMSWIGSLDMEYIYGIMDGLIKAISIMTIDVDLENCMTIKEGFIIEDFGRKEKKYKNNHKNVIEEVLIIDTIK